MGIEVLVGWVCVGLGLLSLLVASLCDVRWRRVPNATVVVLGGTWLGLAALGMGDVLVALAGMATGAGILLSAAWASGRIWGKAGVGGGDVKLSAALGMWMGPARILVVIGCACMLGLLGHALHLAFEVAHGGRAVRAGEMGMPMAPWLSVAAVLVYGICGANVLFSFLKVPLTAL